MALLMFEVVAWGVGVVLLVYVGAQYFDGRRGSAEALERFAELKATVPSPDRTQWSPQRTAAWERTLALPGETPLAVLRIPRIRLEVPVFKGTAEKALNRGVGHIDNTAVPGASGNSGIAGHRDGFFRALKDVTTGDTIELDTPLEKQFYRIVRTWIVTPDAVSVLDPTAEQSVTLVTCYPF
jgi:sortase A